MPLPKRRFSHARTAKRRTHYRTSMPEIQENKSVNGEPYFLRHYATPEGYYKGRKLPGFKEE